MYVYHLCGYRGLEDVSVVLPLGTARAAVDVTLIRGYAFTQFCLVDVYVQLRQRDVIGWRLLLLLTVECG